VHVSYIPLGYYCAKKMEDVIFRFLDFVKKRRSTFECLHSCSRIRPRVAKGIGLGVVGKLGIQYGDQDLGASDLITRALLKNVEKAHKAPEIAVLMDSGSAATNRQEQDVSWPLRFGQFVGEGIYSMRLTGRSRPWRWRMRRETRPSGEDSKVRVSSLVVE